MERRAEGPKVEVERPRCPFCREDVTADAPKTGCEACMAWMHKDCFAEHGKCAACGHAPKTGRPAPTPRPQPAVAAPGVKLLDSADAAVEAHRARAGLRSATTRVKRPGRLPWRLLGFLSLVLVTPPTFLLLVSKPPLLLAALSAITVWVLVCWLQAKKARRASAVARKRP